MKRVLKTVVIAALALAVPASVLAASPHAANKTAMLHVTSKFKSKAGFMHVMASAKLHYTKGDVSIKLTTDGLPKPATLGKKFYVLFATDGAMADRVGVLHISGNMAGASGMVMMNKVQDLNVYATSSMSVKHPQGTLVLSGMVG
jgi:hypothetical protein